MAATVTSLGSANWSVPSTWKVEGLGTYTAADGVFDNGTGILTPTVSPAWTVDALIGRYIDLDGTAYLVSDNDATTATLVAGPASDTYTYKVCGQPLATDIVVMATTYEVADDVARIPATAGSLASLTAVGTGKITVDMTNGTLDGGGIYSTGNITAGTSTVGFIVASGDAPAATFTISAIGNLQGGTANGASAVVWSSSATLTLLGNPIGGNGTTRRGVIVSAGTVHFTGDPTGATGPALYVSGGTVNITPTSLPITVTGGTSPGGYGIELAGGTVNLLADHGGINTVNTASCLALGGATPVWNITGKANYIEFPTVNADGRGSQAMRFALCPVAGEVAEATAGVFEDGANPPGYGVLGTRVDCPVAKALTSSGNYGDPDSPLVGTWVAAANENVRYGFANGVSPSVGDCYVPTAAQTEYGVNVDHTTGLLTKGPNNGSPPYTPTSTLALTTAYYGVVGSLTQGTASGGGVRRGGALRGA